MEKVISNQCYQCHM